MTKTQKINFLILLSIFYFLFSSSVFAASIFFEAENQKFTQGDEFLVNIFLNTEGESINATAGKIIFPSALLELKEIRDGNSAINFWIERPKLEQAGMIRFSGIIPGGLQETKGFLFSVVFKAKASGNGAIQIRDAKVLLNDGKGTEANLKISPFQFSISEKSQAVQPIVQPIKDTDSPEEFKPEIGQNQNVFDGKWFLIFATQDKGAGIERYETYESARKEDITRIDAKKWTAAVSPYLLKDQELKSYVYVKATDRAGNERIAFVEPKYARWYEFWWVWSIMMVSIIIVIFVMREIWERRNTKQY